MYRLYIYIYIFACMPGRMNGRGFVCARRRDRVTRVLEPPTGRDRQRQIGEKRGTEASDREKDIETQDTYPTPPTSPTGKLKSRNQI